MTENARKMLNLIRQFGKVTASEMLAKNFLANAPKELTKDKPLAYQTTWYFLLLSLYEAFPDDDTQRNEAAMMRHFPVLAKMVDDETALAFFRVLTHLGGVGGAEHLNREDFQKALNYVSLLPNVQAQLQTLKSKHETLELYRGASGMSEEQAVARLRRWYWGTAPQQAFEYVGKWREGAEGEAAYIGKLTLSAEHVLLLQYPDATTRYGFRQVLVDPPKIEALEIYSEDRFLELGIPPSENPTKLTQ